jgi:signal transduction histidine kinase
METGRVSVTRRYRSPGIIRGFPVEIKQVFLNLIGNALQAMPNGGKLRLHVFESRKNGRQHPDVCISVCDTGTGIRPEHASRLFEPFFTTKAAKGTGLGLWISKGIVEKYGGTIRVRSISSMGGNITCFQVTLPDADVHAAPEPAPDAAEEIEVAAVSQGRR